jgi:hypothetical protein
VTLNELGRVKLSDVGSAPSYAGADGGPSEWKTLEDYVYLGLFPAIARYRGEGICEPTIGQRPDSRDRLAGTGG